MIHHALLCLIAFYGQSPYYDSGFQRVRLKQDLNLKGWNSQAHREVPEKFESSYPSRDNLSRVIGRTVPWSPPYKFLRITPESHTMIDPIVPPTACLQHFVRCPISIQPRIPWEEYSKGRGQLHTAGIMGCVCVVAQQDDNTPWYHRIMFPTVPYHESRTNSMQHGIRMFHAITIVRRTEVMCFIHVCLFSLRLPLAC